MSVSGAIFERKFHLKRNKKISYFSGTKNWPNYGPETDKIHQFLDPETCILSEKLHLARMAGIIQMKCWKIDIYGHSAKDYKLTSDFEATEPGGGKDCKL